MKGDIMDLPVILVIIIAGIIATLIVSLILFNINAVWPVAGESKTVLEKGISAMYGFDYMIFFSAVGLSFVSIISAFYIRTHPVFFVFSIILLGLVVLVSAVFTNFMDMLVSSPVFSVIIDNFPITVVFVRNFPLFSLIMGIAISIFMYGKPGSGAV